MSYVAEDSSTVHSTRDYLYIPTPLPVRSVYLVVLVFDVSSSVATLVVSCNPRPVSSRVRLHFTYVTW